MRIGPEPLDPETWPAIHALLAPAIERSDTTTHELLRDLLASRAQLWVARDEDGPKGVCVTNLIDGPKSRILHAQLMGGSDIGGWIDEMTDAVLIQAKSIGVQRFTMEGREGWQRALRNRGWKRKAVVMEMDLVGGE